MPTNLGLPMHSPSALTEHVSQNLARSCCSTLHILEKGRRISILPEFGLFRAWGSFIRDERNAAWGLVEAPASPGVVILMHLFDRLTPPSLGCRLPYDWRAHIGGAGFAWIFRLNCRPSHCAQSKPNWKRVQQNFPWIPTVGCFKLVICPSSCAGIEFGQFRPGEIWQPWSSKFGNSEK